VSQNNENALDWRDDLLAEEFRFGVDADDWLHEASRAEAVTPLLTLGDYELLEEISRGGQGVIYRARRREGAAIVALKCLREESLRSPSARRRFEREFEAASMLDHPAIVTVLEHSLEDGSRRFAMPWIDGVPVDLWARPPGSPPRSIEDILALMQEVCLAVHHAHQRGLIHRDLKPSNILVDAQSRPHVLDFGLVKRTAEDAAPDDEPSLTLAGEFVGTLAYASPELLRGDVRQVDVRTDVYALGTILYQIVSGRLPHAHRRDRHLALREAETAQPQRPSIHNPRVPADLDVIILKAIAAEPGRRYQSVAALAEDLGRALRHEPVSARPPQTLYLLRKSMRRNPVGWGIALTALLFIIAGAIAASFAAAHFARLRAQEHEAREREWEAQRIAEEMNQFLTEIFSSADPLRAGGPDLSAREILDAASRRLDQEFADEPVVRAHLQNTLGLSYLGLGMYAESEAQLLAAEESLGKSAARSPALVGEIASNLATLRYEQGRFAEAEDLARHALRTFEGALGEDHLDTARARNNLGAIVRSQGRLEEAQQLYDHALRTRTNQLGPDHPDVAETLNNLAGVLMFSDHPAQAQRLFEEALRIRRLALGENHVLTAQSFDNLAIVLGRQERFDEALPLARQALAIMRNVLDPGHPSIASCASNLGSLLSKMNRPGEAEPLLREALEIRIAAFGPDDRRVATTRFGLGETLRQLGRYEAAERELLEVERALDEQDETHRPIILRAIDSLILLYDAQGRTEEADRCRARRSTLLQ